MYSFQAKFQPCGFLTGFWFNKVGDASLWQTSTVKATQMNFFGYNYGKLFINSTRKRSSERLNEGYDRNLSNGK